MLRIPNKSCTYLISENRSRKEVRVSCLVFTVTVRISSNIDDKKVDMSRHAISDTLTLES